MSGLSVMVQALRAIPDSYTAYFGPVTIGGVQRPRVEALMMPADIPPPFIVVHSISEEPETNLKGHTGMYESRLSLEMIGRSAEGRQQSIPEFITATEAVKRHLDELRRCRIGDYQAQFWKLPGHVSEVGESGLLPRLILDYNCRWRRLS